MRVQLERCLWKQVYFETPAPIRDALDRDVSGNHADAHGDVRDGECRVRGRGRQRNGQLVPAGLKLQLAVTRPPFRVDAGRLEDERTAGFGPLLQDSENSGSVGY